MTRMTTIFILTRYKYESLDYKYQTFFIGLQNRNVLVLTVLTILFKDYPSIFLKVKGFIISNANVLQST